jgi:hypothetical protein
MVANFSPRIDILPLPQRRLWDELASVPKEFVLYGGTAVALHLGHRESIDFDFFGNRPLDPSNLAPTIPFLADAIVSACFGKGVTGMDAGVKPTRTYMRRPLSKHADTKAGATTGA